MLREAIERIMNEYPSARGEVFAEHPLAQYMRRDLPEILLSLMPLETDIRWSASVGQGQWAEAPWIAALNELVTLTPQRGYYPVYLFSYDMSTVFLSFNQGVTILREEFGAGQARDILQHRAKIIRQRLSTQLPNHFSPNAIDLQGTRVGSILAFYEAGHAFGIRYHRDSLPSTEELLTDLRTMLRLYRTVSAQGGVTEFDIDQPIADSPNPAMLLPEKRRLRQHYSAERNPELAKKAKEVHGYKCEVCGFDFAEKYGELGHHFIEAHHIIPLSSLPLNQPTPLSPDSDFAVVCSNCHSMIHRSGAPESFEDFVRLYRRINNS